MFFFQAPTSKRHITSVDFWQSNYKIRVSVNPKQEKYNMAFFIKKQSDDSIVTLDISDLSEIDTDLIELLDLEEGDEIIEGEIKGSIEATEVLSFVDTDEVVE